jgi:hypothetical protein
MSSLRAFSIANLAAHAILPEHSEPWYTAPAIPSFPDRESYKKWMSDANSMVPLFSLVEGENASQRVGGSNPGYKVHGIVTDYDATLSAAEVTSGLARIPSQYPFFAWNRTRRGGIRVLWRFEEPIFFYGTDAFKRLMARAKKELRLTSLFPGLDEDVLVRSDQTYAAGDGWTINATAYIRQESVNLWLFDVLQKATDFDNEVEIPMEVIAAEVEKRFPNRWTGDFREGSRGVRFWDPTADNPTAALVRSTGMTAFTGDRGFVSWADIFGRAFVTQYQEDRIGRAIGDLYCDAEKNYYRPLPDNTWDLCGVEVTKRHLKSAYGLSDSVPKGQLVSEVEQVLHHLEMNRRIEGAIPFPHRPSQIVEWHGNRYLNTAHCKLMMPSDEKDVEWALKFPGIAAYLANLWIDEENFAIQMAWLKVFYESCFKGNPARGQALFIVGPPGTGKSFFSLELLGTIFGGTADAQMFFVEGKRFNSSMFDHAVWSLDDSTILGDRRQHQKFSGLVKACVANPSMAYEKKFGYSGSCPFTGRFVCTLNDDPVSLGVLPDTDQSLLDKVILLRTSDREAELPGSVSQNHDMVLSEGPHFLRWLLEWEIPAWIERDPRFGIKAWHDSKILEEAASVAESLTTIQLIEMFIERYTPNTEGRPWVGNATELLGAMQADDSISGLARRLNPVTLGRQINSAVAAGCQWIYRSKRGSKSTYVYNISKPNYITAAA